MIPKFFLALTFTFLLSSLALSAPGDLDLTFGVGGRALQAVGQVSIDQGRSAAIQPDGKIVIVGDSISDGEFSEEPASPIALRLNPDGSRDLSFGVGGLSVKRIRAGFVGASVAIQPDGKIVIGGYVLEQVSFSVTQRIFVIVRLLQDGTLDSSFGTGGVLKSVLDTNQSTTLTSLALQTDGKIVATGYTAIAPGAGPQALILARYGANGTLDSTFDSDGKIFITVNPTGNRGNSVKLQPDGKIVVGGSLRETTGSITDFLVIRRNADGSPDNSFDGDGAVTTKFGTTTSSILALNLQSDGKIVGVGSSNLGTARDFALARYNTNGTPDNTFDTDGSLTTDVGDDVPTSAAVQSDGKILVSGQTAASSAVRPNFIALRYNSDGTPDTGFDVDGSTITPIGDRGGARSNAVLLQSDGRIVLAGSLIDIPNSDIALARYNTDGSLDNGFDGDGKAIIELGNAGDGIYDTVVQSDGKIVAAGYAFGGNVTQPAIARFNPNGLADPSFGSGGSIVFPAFEQETDTYFSAVALQSDGKIVIGIGSYGAIPFTVVRLNADGTSDSTFGTNGTATIGALFGNLNALALQADGKIVVAGTASGSAIARLNANGLPDSSFGSNGIVVTTDPTISGQVYGMTLQPDGKVIIVGQQQAANPSNYTFFTSRYMTTGSIDTSFGGTGAVYTAFGTSDSAHFAVVQPDGKIVVGGSSFPGAAAARYNGNGTLDNTFDGDGKITVPGQGSQFSFFQDGAVDAKGKLVCVGGQRSLVGFTPATTNAQIFRFNPDGSPDSSFGTNGNIVSVLGDDDSLYFSVNLLPNGKILASGQSGNGQNDDFTIVRYKGNFTGSSAPFDFDGDGKTDIGIFRPSGGEWWINRSGDGQTFALQFGASTDTIVPADYTGDGKADIAVFRPSSGEWYVLRSDDFSYFALPFGTNGDVPVPADYDADGKADFAVFRPSSSTWYITQSSGAPVLIVPFGSTGDAPVVADYDGDGKADIGIIRPAASGAEWWIARSTAGLLAMQFGVSTDKAVQGDYTGDGKADVAIWRPSTGEWFVIRSEDFSYYGFSFGTNGDVVAPGDYDGDGKFDVTVFRPSSATWFIGRSTAGTQIVQFGSNGDRPLPNAFVP